MSPQDLSSGAGLAAASAVEQGVKSELGRGVFNAHIEAGRATDVVMVMELWFCVCCPFGNSCCKLWRCAPPAVPLCRQAIRHVRSREKGHKKWHTDCRPAVHAARPAVRPSMPPDHD